MPDIDVDFEDGRRDEVIAYVGRKYGQDHVAQIITFGTMLARAAIRDVGRVLGNTYGEVDRIAKAVPNQLGITLDEALAGRARAARAGRRRPGGQADHRLRPPARGRRAQRLDPRRRRRHQPRAADRADAAPEGDQLGRADDPVRDARDRGARAAQVRLPRALEPDDPPPGGRHRPRRARHRHRPRRDPARRRDDLRAARLRRDDRHLPARVGGDAPLHPRAPADVGLRPGRHGRALPARPDGQHPRLHPAQARAGAGDLPPPAARAVPGEDLRDLRLPGGHHVRGHGPRRVHRPGGGHARLRDPQEEVRGAARPEGEVRHPGRRARRRADGHRRGLHRLRAVRALRVQQGARHLLRPDRLPDRVPQGELHGRVHDGGPHRVPLERGEGGRRGRRVPADGHRGPAARRRDQPSRVHGRGRRDPVRPAGGQERRPGRHRIDHRGARGGRAVPLADRLLHPHRPAAVQPQGARGADQGRRARLDGPRGPAPARAGRRDRRRPRRPSATGSPARRRSST